MHARWWLTRIFASEAEARGESTAESEGARSIAIAQLRSPRPRWSRRCRRRGFPPGVYFRSAGLAVVAWHWADASLSILQMQMLRRDVRPDGSRERSRS